MRELPADLVRSVQGLVGLLVLGRSFAASGDSSTGRRVPPSAVAFIATHKGQLAGEIVARVGRVWGLYRPLQQLQLDTIERRELPASRVGLGMFDVLAAAAVPGAVLLRRRRVPLSPLLAPIITVTVTAAVFYGTTRFRATAEPSIVLLVTVTAAALWARWGVRRKATGMAQSKAWVAASPTLARRASCSKVVRLTGDAVGAQPTAYIGGRGSRTRPRAPAPGSPRDPGASAIELGGQALRVLKFSRGFPPPPDERHAPCAWRPALAQTL